MIEIITSEDSGDCSSCSSSTSKFHITCGSNLPSPDHEINLCQECLCEFINDTMTVINYDTDHSVEIDAFNTFFVSDDDDDEIENEMSDSAEVEIDIGDPPDSLEEYDGSLVEYNESLAEPTNKSIEL